MGEIIQTRFEDIVPGETGFSPIWLEAIIKKVGRGRSFLPIPSKDSDFIIGKKINLDGRHRLLYCRMTGSKSAPLYVAQHREDYLKSSRGYSWEVERNNQTMSLRWVEADETALELGMENYNDYFDILSKEYPFIKSIDSFLEFRMKNPNQSEILGADIGFTKSAFR